MKKTKKTNNKNAKIKETKNKFRFSSKDIFLTYSKCSLGKNVIHNHIKNLMNEKKKNIIYIISNTENHADHKEIHTHVLLQLEKIFQTENARFFDIEGFHPRIENAQHIEKSIDYIKKDGDFIENGIPRIKKYVRQNQKEERKQLIYDEIFRLKKEYYENESLKINKIRKNLDEFMIKIDRDFYLEQIELIERILKKKFIKKAEENMNDNINENETESIYDFDSFKDNEITRKIIAAIQKEKDVQHRPRSLVIEGLSRIGKTEFIISFLNKNLIPFNYIRGSLDFSKEIYKNEYKINVFDDISIFEIKKHGLLKNIIGGQRGFNADIKYAPKRRIAGNKLNIFLCNEDISFVRFCKKNKEMGGKEYEYIEKNCIFFNVKEKLYKEND
ncbi:hypothetical protein [Vaccinium witches'-broom phytoplasma]|uniref:hypothetical protein n=1 Tax=Vaccinium witches'-broom phytoplasma TaxID=85642 RepID=UPI00037487C1|nr:hypothetical protein [Vaccinium witches'-broom phytoplasma]